MLTITFAAEWNQIVIKSGLETMEIAKEIETSELLRRWRWYAGALQQHNYATLMLVEAFGYPGTEHAKRAWESMDWIFQVPSCVPYDHKARWVMEGAVGVMREYYKARKLRCPTLMDERLVKVSSSSPTAKLPKPRELAARPRELAQSSSKGTSHSGQSRVNSRGILEDHLGTCSHEIARPGTASNFDDKQHEDQPPRRDNAIRCSSNSYGWDNIREGKASRYQASTSPNLRVYDLVEKD